MPTHHLTLEGTRVPLAGLTAVQRKFLRGLERLAKKGTSYFDVLEAAVGRGTVAMEGNGFITPRVISAPIYVIALDIATRVGVAQDLLLHPHDQKKLEDARKELGYMLSVAQAAEHIGISRAAVYKAIDKGSLKAVQIGSLTLVVFTSANAYRKARSKRAA